MSVSAFDSLILKMKRGHTPGYRFLGSIARRLLRPQAPIMPAVLRPVLRSLYELHYSAIQAARLSVTLFYRHPLFQGRCVSIGHNVSIDGLPFVSGHCENTSAAMCIWVESSTLCRAAFSRIPSW